ncbi:MULTISPECIES: hypothetical protein [Microbacterium]|uniref:hypothetical protein n=1 Tax=Microbacterium TaxID=33882 RepID=UPI000D6468A7|nr:MULTISPECIES: hypothetical protein [Microbacterium]
MDDKNSTPETSPAADRPADAGRTDAVAGTPAPAVGTGSTDAASATRAHSADAPSTAASAATPAPAHSTEAGRADTFAAPPAAGPKRRRTRGLLIAGGSVLAAALLAGGGIAVGAAIADELGDGDDTSSSVSDDQDDDSRDGGGDDANDDSAGGDLSNLGTDSADDVVAMVDAAAAAGEGEPVSIEFERDGSAEVTLEAADGADTEVRVDAAGEASVISTEQADADDTAPQNVLDTDAIAAIVDAALAEADGRVVEIEADDDSASPWDVTVLTGAGEFIEIGLDTEFAVVGTGTDSDD